MTYIQGLDLMIVFIDTLYTALGPTCNYSAIADLHTLQFTSSDCNLRSHMKSSFHSLIPFLPLFCNCQCNSIPLLPSIYPSRLASRNSTNSSQLNSSLCKFARTMKKTQPLYCWEGVFTALLHNNGSYLIVACVFVVAGTCLPSCSLAVNVYSDYTVPVFGRRAMLWTGFKWFSILSNGGLLG
jgi:hypothetical protein